MLCPSSIHSVLTISLCKSNITVIQLMIRQMTRINMIQTMYPPSDQEDEDFEANFVEDIQKLKEEDETIGKEAIIRHKSTSAHRQRHLIPNHSSNF
jgi:hypothetical protein